MDGVRYRRSSLRDVLLDRALVVVHDRGAGALSLRELARDAGVSHAAPARHFADRSALLDAVAVAGFEQLAAQIVDAAASAGPAEVQAGRVALVYVSFTVDRAHLAGVMFRHDSERDEGAIGQAAQTAFAPLVDVFQRAEAEGRVPAGSAETRATLFLAALQGLAALVNCGVVPRSSVPELLDEAVARFVGEAAIGTAPQRA
ncbi:TetR/AcrR family transcriptional regulator [Microbacterium sp. RD1]|uniref:TetR/AcrR family transcriptional regulator n=1 Tax=Microbacterium sp. RD1 TaxID=3457313 RepID=UPI003FA59B9B